MQHLDTQSLQIPPCLTVQLQVMGRKNHIIAQINQQPHIPFRHNRTGILVRFRHHGIDDQYPRARRARHAQRINGPVFGMRFQRKSPFCQKFGLVDGLKRLDSAVQRGA